LHYILSPRLVSFRLRGAFHLPFFVDFASWRFNFGFRAFFLSSFLSILLIFSPPRRNNQVMKLHRPKLKDIHERAFFPYLGKELKHVAVFTDASEIMQSITSFHQY